MKSCCSKTVLTLLGNLFWDFKWRVMAFELKSNQSICTSVETDEWNSCHWLFSNQLTKQIENTSRVFVFNDCLKKLLQKHCKTFWHEISRAIYIHQNLLRKVRKQWGGGHKGEVVAFLLKSNQWNCKNHTGSGDGMKSTVFPFSNDLRKKKKRHLCHNGCMDINILKAHTFLYPYSKEPITYSMSTTHFLPVH